MHCLSLSLSSFDICTYFRQLLLSLFFQLQNTVTTGSCGEMTTHFEETSCPTLKEFRDLHSIVMMLEEKVRQLEDKVRYNCHLEYYRPFFSLENA